MSSHPHYKTPRLHTSQSLTNERNIELDKEQTHYLKNVMRLDAGAPLRLFNGKDGEWLSAITSIDKKRTILTLRECIHKQPPTPTPIHILFAPIKKQRMDFLIEKAVELGATHLHPVLTDHTENRKIKPERIQAQIIEATEQCERLDIPQLSAPAALKDKIALWTEASQIFWAAERAENAKLITQTKNIQAILIGPEGGFSDNECAFLHQRPNITPISLGERILRAETATLYALSHMKK